MAYLECDDTCRRTISPAINNTAHHIIDLCRNRAGNAIIIPDVKHIICGVWISSYSI